MRKTKRELINELEELDKKIEEIKLPLKDKEILLVELRVGRKKIRDDDSGLKTREYIQNLELKIETLKKEIKDLLDPLLITKSNLLDSIGKIEKTSQLKREREQEKRIKGESAINLKRWMERSIWREDLEWGERMRLKGFAWKMLSLAFKREKQVLEEICVIYNLKLVKRKDLSDHYARKYKQYRLKKYGRGYYLLSI